MQLFWSSLRVPLSQTGQGELARGLDGILDQLDLAPCRHTAQDVELDPLRLSVRVAGQGWMSQLMRPIGPMPAAP